MVTKSQDSQDSVTRWDHLRDQDRAARHAAVTVFDHPVVLIAGAGTGKTAALTSRVAAWCLGKGWERSASAHSHQHSTEDPTRWIANRTIERVVAITFTDHAAAEMATRIAFALTSVHAQKPVFGLEDIIAQLGEREAQRRALALSSSLDRLRVLTIHAFCMRILASFPLLARLHPHFTVDADQSALTEILDDLIAEEFVNAFGETGNADVIQLTLWGIGTDNLRDALSRLTNLGVTAENIPENPYDPQRVQALVTEIIHHLQPLLTTVGPALRLGKTGRLKVALSTIETLAWLQSTLQVPPEVDLCQTLIQACTTQEVSSAIDKLTDWGKGKWSQTEAEALLDCLDVAQEASARVAALLTHSQRMNPERLTVLTRVLRGWLAEVLRRMRVRGAQSFNALLSDTATLLDNHPEVPEYLRQNIDQLLVDEFQDTDPLQCGLVRHLGLSGPAHERPGLFLVGDPKQSIYGWRSADLVAYSNFIDEVLTHGGKSYVLSVNFRSTQIILDEVERIIAPHMRSGGPAHPPFQPLVAHGDPTSLSPLPAYLRPVEHWVAWEWKDGVPNPDTRSEAARVLEAEAIATDIVMLTRPASETNTPAPVRYGDIAILLRSTTALETYLHPLREKNIPFVVERDRSYFRRREIKDAVSLFRVIVDPNDHTALVALLRSPMVGVPDAALAPLWQLKLPGLMSRLRDPSGLTPVLEAVDKALPKVPVDVPGMDRLSGFEHTLKHTILSIATLRESLQTEPSDTFVTRMRTLFAQEITEAARYLGAHRLANLDRFYRRLEETLRTVSGGPWAVLNHLRESVQDEREESEGVPGDSALEAVRIMTIHKAKGLTFDHVYVVGMHGKSRPKAQPVADVAHATTSGHPQEWECCLFGIPTPGYYRVEQQRMLTEAGERVRTLYVALTRPRLRLVMLGLWPAEPRFITAENATCHLDLATHRGADQMAPLLTATSKLNNEDNHGVLWRLCGGPESDGALSFEGAANHPQLDVEQAVFAATTLEAHIQQAARISARRFTTTAVAPVHHSVAEQEWSKDSDDSDPENPIVVGTREQAMAVGTAVHSAMEHIELHGDLTRISHHPPATTAKLRASSGRAPSAVLSGLKARLRASPVRAPRIHGHFGTLAAKAGEKSGLSAEIQRLSNLIPQWIPPLDNGMDRDQVILRAQQILRRLENSQILRRLTTLTVLARELPFVLEPTPCEDPVLAAVFQTTVGAVVGAIDVLCQDPVTGQIVVIDYKTDTVSTMTEAQVRAQSYLTQCKTYQEAVRRALRLSSPPQVELWFLQSDLIVAWTTVPDGPV